MRLPEFLRGVWRFMHFTTLPRPYAPGVYMHRLQLVETPWFSVRLHLIRFPDEDPHPHDYPFDFLSFVLWGWYDEARPGRAWRRIRWFNRCRAAGQHKILRISNRNVVTLVLTTGRHRRWGYQTEAGWVLWREYKAMQREQSFATLARR